MEKKYFEIPEVAHVPEKVQIVLKNEFANEPDAKKAFNNTVKQVSRILQSYQDVNHFVAVGLSYCNSKTHKIIFKNKSKYKPKREFVIKSRKTKIELKKYTLNIFYDENLNSEIGQKIITYLKERFSDKAVRRKRTFRNDMLNALLFSKPTVIYEYLNAKEEKDKKITDIKRVNDFKRIYSQTLEDKMILQLGEKDELTKKIQEDTKAQRKMTLMQQGNKSKKQIEKECLDKLIYFTKENLEKILKNNKKIHQDIKNKLWKIEDTQIDKSNFIKISLKKKKKLKKGKKTIEYFFFFRGNLETFKELPLYTFIKLPYAKQLPNRKARLELKALIKQAK